MRRKGDRAQGEKIESTDIFCNYVIGYHEAIQFKGLRQSDRGLPN